MTILTFVDAGRIYRWKKIYRKGSSGIKKKRHSLSLHFYMLYVMEFLDKIRKVLLLLRLSVYHHGLQWEDRMISYSMVKT